MINRGGEKISPIEIDEVLRAHPAIADAAAFAIPDPWLGDDISAAVVLRAECALDKRAMRRWAAGCVLPHKIPPHLVG